MKRILFSFVIAFFISISAFSQATSLTVDCQNPGWLSSLINYSNQQTLKNIKVTGYINGTDIKFIRTLNTSLNLHGVIDLEDANIVAGGEAYYVYKNQVPFYTETNVLTKYMFAYLDSLQKLVLPKSLIAFSGDAHFVESCIDSLVINGTMEDVAFSTGAAGESMGSIRYLSIPEGVKNLNLFRYFYNYYQVPKYKVLCLPSSIESIQSHNACIDETLVVYCSSTNPETISTGYTNSNYALFNNGTIYVPKGTKSKYQNSIFKKLTIIEDIPVDSIRFNNRSPYLHVGEKKKLSVAIYPGDTPYKDLTFSVENPNICTIDSTGLVDALSVGSTKVYAYSHQKLQMDSCIVTVYNHTTGVEMSEETMTLKIGETSTLTATTLPEGTSDGMVNWTSSDNSIATVDAHGKVKGMNQGLCNITATSVDMGYTATCEVTVIKGVETLTIDKHELSLKVGETAKINAQITPADADNKNITWSSSDEEIASVDATGKVTALKAGEAWIKATSNDNIEAQDSCALTVIQPVTGITLSPSSYELGTIGDTVQLVATVLPEDATNKEVRWNSSNEAVCMVSNGKVVATGKGVAVVLATTVDGGFLATATITVLDDSAIDTISIDELNNNSTIYDINGRKYISGKDLPSGIYIINGKKVLLNN